MRVTEALYRGEDSKGQPFSLRAGSAVQKTSREPIVELNDMIARILLNDGPAVLTAQKGIYHMDREEVAVPGPVQFKTADGYCLTTRDVDIGMKASTLKSHGVLDGRVPVGTLTGYALNAILYAPTDKIYALA